MVATLLSLKDKFILPDGRVVYNEATLFDLIKKKINLETLNIQRTKDTELFLLKSGKKLTLVDIDDADIETLPPLESYDWNIPEDYKNIDLLDLCINRLILLNKHNDIYIERLQAEFEQIYTKDMSNFLKAVLFITDIFRAHHAVFGLGRGSSCASLVLYLLDINKVDPVKYDISMNEFFK